VKGPIGRIGKPINNLAYLHFREKGIQLFVEKKLVDALPESGGRINVLMGDYGAWPVVVE
jgi:hypothetical protein